MFADPEGRVLTCGENGGLSLTDASADDRLSLWQLTEAENGYCIRSAGAVTDRDGIPHESCPAGIDERQANPAMHVGRTRYMIIREPGADIC